MHSNKLNQNLTNHFSLRKLSIGVVSILIGVSFAVFDSNHVMADTTSDYHESEEQTESTINDSQKSQNTSEQNEILTTEKTTDLAANVSSNKNQLTSDNTFKTNIPVNKSKDTKQEDYISKNNSLTNNSTTSKQVKILQNIKKTSNNKTVQVKQPERVSVHDPSIFQDPKTGKYYVFGSHQAEAESDDLYNWKPLFKKEYEQPSFIFANYDQDLSKIFKWAGSHDGDAKNGYAIWAPDEIYNPDYVWKDGSKGAYMYYFATSSSWIHSAIGFAASKTVHGPYQFQDTLIYSGFTKNKEHNGDSSSKNDIYTNTNIKDLIDKKIINGFSNKWVRADGTYNNDYAPNAIDVNIVTDKNNNLWMSYGSWSGGIYLLPLDKKTGKVIYPGKDSTNEYGQEVDRYFGTHLIGGFHESGEAPYIKYDKNTGYYYLFVTYGGLTREGGYNMRLFRSKEINGKYVDAMGQHPVYTQWKTNDVTKQENQKYGIKLEGNYDFSCLPYAYMSPGHNSAFIDKNGTWFLINHTRFNHGTEYHELRVKEMIMTQNGWPIPLPFEYTEHEDKISSQNINDVLKQIPGQYEFVNNGNKTSGIPIARALVKLTTDHQVSGGITGTWESTQKNNRIILTITDKDGTKYIGEFKLQQDESEKHIPVLVFAALGDNNNVIWGEKEYKVIPSNNTEPSTSINNPNPEPVKEVQNSDSSVNSVKLMHNSFIYDQNGFILSLPELKSFNSLSVITPSILIKNRRFYQLSNNSKQYIPAENINGKTRKLTHNAFIYNNKGKRIKRNIILKRGTNIKTYGSPVKISKKLYYCVGVNEFIKVNNFKTK